MQTPCSFFDNVSPIIGHTLFGWAHQGLPCATDRTVKDNHFVIQPWEPYNLHSSDAVIYYPVYKQLPKPNLNNRKSIVWAAKGPYIDEWPEDRIFHHSGLKYLKAMSRLSKEHGVRSVFVDAYCFDSKRAKRLGAKDLFDSIEHKTTYKRLINANILNEEFDQARITTMLHGYFSSAFIAPAHGAVPIYFQGNDVGTVWHPPQRLLNMDMTDDEFYSVLERFYIDDEYYLERLGKSLEIIEKFSYASSYQSFLKFIERVKTR
jgi:hypothetical protein